MVKHPWVWFPVQKEKGKTKTKTKITQHKQDPKQLRETLSLNKTQSKTEDVAQWVSAPDYNLRTHPNRKINK